MKKIAVMQPYIFPYMGYMNLVNASDHFVFYDDVNFMKKGWVNRNRILINSEPFTFTVPLINPSQNKLIMDLQLSSCSDFMANFEKQLMHAYKKSPYFNQGMNYVDRVFSFDSKRISILAAKSIEEFFKIIEIEKEFSFSSNIAQDTRGMGKADRLIAITKKLQGSNYLNAIDGMKLYEKSYFMEKGVVLEFVKGNLTPYKQKDCLSWKMGLSVIDMVMNLSKKELKAHVCDYELL